MIGKNRFNTLSAAVMSLGITIGLCSSPAMGQSGIEKSMQDMFDGMTSVNAPGRVSTQGRRRGMVHGGSVHVRYPIVRETWYEFTPPSISAGCAGVDMFSGSFSYVNSDRLVAMARATIANAKGYFFKLSLRALCSTCENTMEDLASKVNSLNQLMADSCNNAENLVKAVTNFDETKPGLLDSHSDRLRDRVNRTESIFPDEFVARFSTGGVQRASESEAYRGQQAESGMSGNLMWQLLDRGAGFNFENAIPNTTRYWEEIMSLTGTVIIENVATEEGRGSRFIDIPATLSVKDLVLGSRTQLDSDGSETTIGVEFLRCQPGTVGPDVPISERCNKLEGSYGADGAFRPTRDTKLDFEGLKTKVENLLVGSGCEDDISGCTGIVYKYGRVFDGNVVNQSLTGEELAFIASMPASYHSMIRELAIRDPHTAASFVMSTSEVLAYQIAMEYVEQVLRALRVNAGAMHEWQTRAGVIKKLEDARTEARAQMAKAQAEIANESAVFDLYANYLQMIPNDHTGMDIPTRSTSSPSGRGSR